MSEQEFSLLREPYSKPPRALHIALAHRIAQTKMNDPYMTVLNRIYAVMSWAQRAKCRAELSRCRDAQRHRAIAQVA
jgi:hypothetical protein